MGKETFVAQNFYSILRFPEETARNLIMPAGLWAEI